MKKVEPDYTYLKFYNIENVPLKMSELIHKDLSLIKEIKLWIPKWQKKI
jgi:hypothetical protein